MAQLLPNVKQKFFDANGVPLAGGKLYSYIASTSTLQATFTDQTELTQNANPLVLDANGEGSVWINGNAYKFVLQDSNGITIWTVDNVSSVNALSITTAKLADSAVTTAKLANGALSADATGQAKMADGFLTADTAGRAKMADGFVTQAKRAALATASSAFISSSTVSSSRANVPSMNCTIACTGRPIVLMLIGDNNSNINLDSTGVSSGSGIIAIQKDSGGGYADLTYQIYEHVKTGATYVTSIKYPVAFYMLDLSAAAGNISYRVQFSVSSGTLYINNVKLVAIEL